MSSNLKFFLEGQVNIFKRDNNFSKTLTCRIFCCLKNYKNSDWIPLCRCRVILNCCKFDWASRIIYVVFIHQSFTSFLLPPCNQSFLTIFHCPSTFLLSLGIAKCLLISKYWNACLKILCCLNFMNPWIMWQIVSSLHNTTI